MIFIGPSLRLQASQDGTPSSVKHTDEGMIMSTPISQQLSSRSRFDDLREIMDNVSKRTLKRWPGLISGNGTVGQVNPDAADAGLNSVDDVHIPISQSIERS